MKVKLLFWDIETAPIISYTWGLFDQNVGLNQIVKDWHLLAFAAKWQGSSEIIYKDQRKESDVSNDKPLLKVLWNLLDKADVVVTHNGKKFDARKVNARFAFHKMKPPSSYKHIDTLLLAKKHHAFTSNKLEYLSGILTPTKKHDHKKFPGFELWSECLKGNPAAWKEMEIYNKRDVEVLEAVYNKLIPYDHSIDFSIYEEGFVRKCSCGSSQFVRNGVAYTPIGRYQRYACKKCGREGRAGKNQLTPEKRASLLRSTR